MQAPPSNAATHSGPRRPLAIVVRHANAAVPVLDCTTMRILRMSVLVALLAVVPMGSAQLLAEVTLTTAIASELYPAVRLPSGTYRADGPDSSLFLASLPDAASFGSWEVYTATGLIARLKPAFIRDITNGFAIAGLYEAERREWTVGARTHTRYLFSDGASEAVLYVVSDAETVAWAVGRKER